MRRLTASLCLLPLLGTEVLAQSIVVPQANANTRGVSGISTLLNTTAGPRTYMIGMPASELMRIPAGSVITGVSFRSYVGTGSPTIWPSADATFANYDVTVGYALPLGSWTTTFMSNFVNTPIPPVQVRAGPMVIDANIFPNNSALPAPQPNPWGDFFWDFQKTFIYLGGDLGILFAHTGSDQGNTSFVDYLNVSPATGVAFIATAYNQPTGMSQPYTIPRLHYGYGGGCPGTGGMVPMLVQSNDVAGGGTVTFGIANARPASVALYVVGARSQGVPLSNGCTLLATPTILLPVGLNSKGRNALTTTFPAGLSLTAYVQAFVIDAGALGGFAATNGVTLTVSP